MAAAPTEQARAGRRAARRAAVARTTYPTVLSVSAALHTFFFFPGKPGVTPCQQPARSLTRAQGNDGQMGSPATHMWVEEEDHV